MKFDTATDTMVSCRFRPSANPTDFMEFSKVVDSCAARILQGQFIDYGCQKKTCTVRTATRPRRITTAAVGTVAGGRVAGGRVVGTAAGTMAVEPSIRRRTATATATATAASSQHSPDIINLGRKIFSNNMEDLYPKEKKETSNNLNNVSRWENDDDNNDEEEEERERESVDFTSPPPLWRGDMRASLRSSLRSSSLTSLHLSLRSLDHDNMTMEGKGSGRESEVEEEDDDDDEVEEEEVHGGGREKKVQQGGMNAREIIATQQVQINMLQTQVEKLSELITEMTRVNRMQPIKKHAAELEERLVAAQQLAWVAGGVVVASSDMMQEETGREEEEEEEPVVDNTPVNPALRLSVPLFQQKRNDGKIEKEEGEGEEEEEEEEELFPVVADKPRLPLYDVDVPRIVYDDEEEDDDDDDDDEYDQSEISRNGENHFYSEYNSMASGADLSSFQEGPTIARIEAKYMLRGERAAALRGQRFVQRKYNVPEDEEGIEEEEEEYEVEEEEEEEEEEEDDNEEGYTQNSTPTRKMLDRHTLFNQPKFK